MALIDEVLKAAGLDEEGDTPDRRLTLRFNTCLGACSQAPVISIDHQLHGRLSPETAREKVAALLGPPVSRPGR